MKSEAIDDLQKKLESRVQAFANASARGGLIGGSGRGKSSLINVIAGRKLAPVGVVETSGIIDDPDKPKEWTTGGITFVDLPGCGTKSFPREKYIKRFSLASYDFLVLVTAERFEEGDIYLYRELKHRQDKPVFVVRTKYDRAIEDGQLDNRLDEQQIRTQIIENIREQLSAPDENIYLISSRHPDRYDLTVLISDIARSLPGIKRKKFLADAAAWTKEGLQEKREAAYEIVGPAAGLAAINAFNPIIGTDIAVDLSILLGLSHTLRKLYGLDDETLAYTAKVLGQGPAAFQAMKQNMTKRLLQFISTDGIITLLQRYGARYAAKSILKWIPLIGQAFAAGISFKMTYSFGEELLDAYEAESLKVISESLAVPWKITRLEYGTAMIYFRSLTTRGAPGALAFRRYSLRRPSSPTG